MSRLISSLSTKVADRITWSGKQDRTPYRVWVTREENSFSVIGVMASNLIEIKDKAFQFLNNVKNLEGKIKKESLSILTKNEGTTIVDDDYLEQLPPDKDLVLLLPGQTWEEIHRKLKWSSDDDSVEHNALVCRNASSGQCQNSKSDFRYFVPVPDGEVARFTVDVFRERPTDAGCVRLTAATAGDAGMTVSYELRLNGARTVIHYALRWTASLLTFAGKLMVDTGEILKSRLK